MFKLLIFGGTTEGRKLAEYCIKNNMDIDVCVATDYGASLLPEGIDCFCGRLDTLQMIELMKEESYFAIVDATHPYAVDVSINIRKACKAANLPYYRLIRDSSELWGETVETIEEMIQILNKCDDTILCSLGRKALPMLTNVRNYRERFWIRVLPSEDIYAYCRSLGYDEKKIICERGPFTVQFNTEHIHHTNAKILLTKESGATGGYPEKAEAARICGIRMITLVRQSEEGFLLEEIEKLLERERKN